MRLCGTLRGEAVEIEVCDLGLVDRLGSPSDAETPEGEFYGTEFRIGAYEPHQVLVERRIVERHGVARRAYEERMGLRDVGVEVL